MQIEITRFLGFASLEGAVWCNASLTGILGAKRVKFPRAVTCMVKFGYQ